MVDPDEEDDDELDEEEDDDDEDDEDDEDDDEDDEEGVVLEVEGIYIRPLPPQLPQGILCSTGIEIV